MNNIIIKLLVFTGNVMCIYRNIRSFSFVGRFFIWVRIFIELTLLLSCVFTHYTYIEEYKSQFLYWLLTFSSSNIIIILACYHCKNFESLIKFIEETHAFFIKDKEYNESLNNKYKRIIFAMVAYPTISLGSILHSYIIYPSYFNDKKIILLNTISFICNLRYIFEYVALSCILFVLSEQLNGITHRITKERSVTFMANQRNDIPFYTGTNLSTHDTVQEITSFEDWTAFYMNIKECSNLINTIFGLEITMIITTVVFYLIFFLYSIAYITINGSTVKLDLVSYVIRTLIFLVALYMLSESAQIFQNSADQLKRRLGRLLIHSTEDLVCYKETKDLLRLISSHPIRTQAFGSICIDMSLLPKFIMFFTSYTVIALQFNNVV